MLYIRCTLRKDSSLESLISAKPYLYMLSTIGRGRLAIIFADLYHSGIQLQENNLWTPPFRPALYGYLGSQPIPSGAIALVIVSTSWIGLIMALFPRPQDWKRQLLSIFMQQGLFCWRHFAKSARLRPPWPRASFNGASEKRPLSGSTSAGGLSMTNISLVCRLSTLALRLGTSDDTLRRHFMSLSRCSLLCLFSGPTVPVTHIIRHRVHIIRRLDFSLCRSQVISSWTGRVKINWYNSLFEKATPCEVT